jgi:hypothetical protein
MDGPQRVTVGQQQAFEVALDVFRTNRRGDRRTGRQAVRVFGGGDWPLLNVKVYRLPLLPPT